MYTGKSYGGWSRFPVRVNVRVRVRIRVLSKFRGVLNSRARVEDI